MLLSSLDRDSAIFRAYRDHYEAIAENDLASTIQGDQFLRSHADHLLAQLGDLEGRSVCDVGIGQGLVFEGLAERRPSALIGVDIAWPYLRRYAGGRHAVTLANAENLPFEQAFDLLVCTDVMEHVLNLGDFLVSAFDALQPGGIAVLRVPNTEDLTQYSTRRGAEYRFVHLRGFDRATLNRQVSDAGFSVERTVVGGWWWGRHRSWVSRSSRVESWLRRLVLDRYGGDQGVNSIHPLLGRLLMEPVDLTIFARRPSD